MRACAGSQLRQCTRSPLLVSYLAAVPSIFYRCEPLTLAMPLAMQQPRSLGKALRFVTAAAAILASAAVLRLGSEALASDSDSPLCSRHCPSPPLQFRLGNHRFSRRHCSISSSSGSPCPHISYSRYRYTTCFVFSLPALLAVATFTAGASVVATLACMMPGHSNTTLPTGNGTMTQRIPPRGVQRTTTIIRSGHT